MAKKPKSNEIKSTDGRKYNKRLPSKVKLKGSVTTKPAAMNQAKKDRVGKFAINAIKKVYGNEAGAMEKLAELSEDSFQHMKLLLEYAYGKAGENIQDQAPRRTNAPVINFFNTQLPEGDKEEGDTIDIDSEEVDDIEDEKFIIQGFPKDWANTTQKIISLFIWAFSLVLIYPHLPGSTSPAFRGVSIFIGAIVSFGSTSAIML